MLISASDEAADLQVDYRTPSRLGELPDDFRRCGCFEHRCLITESLSKAGDTDRKRNMIVEVESLRKSEWALAFYSCPPSPYSSEQPPSEVANRHSIIIQEDSFEANGVAKGHL